MLDIYKWTHDPKIPKKYRNIIVGLLCGYSTETLGLTTITSLLFCSSYENPIDSSATPTTGRKSFPSAEGDLSGTGASATINSRLLTCLSSTWHCCTTSSVLIFYLQSVRDKIALSKLTGKRLFLFQDG